MNQFFTSEHFEPLNRAFLQGDAVSVFFYIRNGKPIMSEEIYFFLMASMRKMRMNIPLDYTLDFFEEMFLSHISENMPNCIIRFLAFRNLEQTDLAKVPVSFYFDINPKDILAANQPVELDLIKEINVNTNLLSGIRVHCPENVYAQIYAVENGLADVILLNPSKRIARASTGNLLFLEQNTIKIPKQSEGAYISPLMENFVTFVHKNGLAEIEETEMIAFESQKADEILLVSDEHGISPVGKIRNKEFGNERFGEMLAQWKNSFL